MALEKKEFEQIILASFPNAKIVLTDMLKDADHYSLEITSPDFTNLSLLQSHRLINERLKSVIGTKVHALTILSINVI